MLTPTLEEKKDYWLWNYAHESFEQVAATCEMLTSTKFALPVAVVRVLTAGTIVTYARPFTTCHGAGKLSDVCIPKEHRALHAVLLDLRHKCVAHIDAINFKADDPKFGNINRVSVRFSPGAYQTFIVVQPQLDWSAIRALAQKLIAKANYYLDRFNEKYLTNTRLPHGDYILNIDPANPVFLERKRS